MSATLLTVLDTHLNDLSGTPDERQWCANWRRSDPDLEHHTLQQVKLAAQGRARSAERCTPRGDTVYSRLIQEHLTGDQIATAILLAAVAPMLRALTATITPRRFPTREDAEAAAVAALLEALPRLQTHRQNLAMTIRLAVLNALAGRSSRPETLPATEIACDTIYEPTQTPEPGSGHILGTVGEALELLAWGVDVGAITASEADLLARLHVPDEDDALRAGTAWKPDRARLSAELGCTPAALKMRTHRAIARLRESLVQTGMLTVAPQGDRRELSTLAPFHPPQPGPVEEEKRSNPCHTTR